MSIKAIIFFNVTPCSVGNGYHCFGGNYCLHLHIYTREYLSLGLTVTLYTYIQEVLCSNLDRGCHRSIQAIPTDHIIDVINSVIYIAKRLWA
jgi:hypothetical protein